jgi:hypothetical protein
MVADRAGPSGSCQALLMMVRVASPVGRRIGDGGGFLVEVARNLSVSSFR